MCMQQGGGLFPSKKSASPHPNSSVPSPSSCLCELTLHNTRHHTNAMYMHTPMGNTRVHLPPDRSPPPTLFCRYMHILNPTCRGLCCFYLGNPFRIDRMIDLCSVRMLFHPLSCQCCLFTPVLSPRRAHQVCYQPFWIPFQCTHKDTQIAVVAFVTHRRSGSLFLRLQAMDVYDASPVQIHNILLVSRILSRPCSYNVGMTTSLLLFSIKPPQPSVNYGTRKLRERATADDGVP